MCACFGRLFWTSVLDARFGRRLICICCFFIDDDCVSSVSEVAPIWYLVDTVEWFATTALLEDLYAAASSEFD